MTRRETTALSDAEWRVMQVLWKRGDCTLRMLLDALTPDTDWSKHTILSFLKRMEAKNAICALETQPRAWRALLNREETLGEETRSVLDRVYGGDCMLMVSNAVQNADLSEEEVRQLVELLMKGR